MTDHGIGGNSAYGSIRVELDRLAEARAKGFAASQALATASGSFDALAKPKFSTIVAEGDSWLDYPFNDIADCLDDIGYDVKSVARHGHVLEDIAHVQLAELVQEVQKRKPRFVLLSAGGNDIADAELAMLVNHKNSLLATTGQRLRPGMIRYLFDVAFFDAYCRIIETVNDAAKASGIAKLDIVGHGYAYPFADGRPAFWVFGPWLRPPLERRGYHIEAERNDLMKELIIEMNQLQARLATSYGNYRYVDLRDHMKDKDDWANELHPTQEKFAFLAHQVHLYLQTLLA